MAENSGKPILLFASVPDWEAWLEENADHDGSPVAADLFSRLSSQNRFAILFRISGVKGPATRAANIAKFVAMLERGETIYPQKP